MHCTSCNSEQGYRAVLTFSDSDKELTLQLCEECFSAFSSDEQVSVARLDD